MQELSLFPIFLAVSGSSSNISRILCKCQGYSVTCFHLFRSLQPEREVGLCIKSHIHNEGWAVLGGNIA